MIKGQQAEALSFLNNWLDSRELLGLLRGYAGTGKTWLIGHWLEEHYFKRYPNRTVYILAPTNKALDVLRSKCAHLQERYKVAFMTIDSFLGNRIKRNDDGETVKSRGKGQDNPDLIVCDEGSMIKKEYDADLRAKRVKTLYCADAAQLPPINEDLSTVFNIESQYEMTEVVRYEGAIIQVATFLRQCIQTGEQFILSDLMQFKDEARTLSFIKMHQLHDWAIKARNKGLDARIVAFENATVDEHNAVMHRILYPDAPLYGVGEQIVVNETFEIPTGEVDDKGDEIVVMLYNGETMTVTSCERAADVAGVVIYDVGVTYKKPAVLEVDGQPVEPLMAEYVLQVAFDPYHMTSVHKDLTNQIWTARRAGRPEAEVKKLVNLRAPLNKLAPLRHSYACTVHKSQGSTYDICFCDFSSIYRCKDRARMMYVADTRPSKWLVIASK